MTRAVVITGDKEIDKSLSQFEAKIQRKTLRKASKTAANLILRDAKTLVPHETGLLEASLKVRPVRKSRTRIGHSVTTREGLFQGNEFYGGFVELGTENMEADPYLRPALYTNQEAAKLIYKNELRAELRRLPTP